MNSDFIGILELIQKSFYNVAKYRLAILHNLSMNKNCFDFYGDEYTNFVQLLQIFTSHHLKSTCSSKECPRISI